MAETPLDRNNGWWYTQEMDFGERMGHAVRYEFEAKTKATNAGAYLKAVAHINLPEPSGCQLALPILGLLGMLRRRPTKHTVQP